VPHGAGGHLALISAHRHAEHGHAVSQCGRDGAVAAVAACDDVFGQRTPEESATNVRSRSLLPARLGLVLAGLITAAVASATPVRANVIGCSPDDPSQPHAELFATTNTAVITDADDPRLRDRLELFELQVDTTVLANAAVATGSTLVDGVSWSAERHQLTYERSRDFHLSCVDEFELHRIADQVRQQFLQESVLTFRQLPHDAPEVDAVTVEVPDVDSSRLYAALAGDPVARDRLVGGSVTEDRTLILVADIADLELARQLAVAAGGQTQAATVRYGRREFVE
jgi:hypothetical protein